MANKKKRNNRTNTRSTINGPTYQPPVAKSNTFGKAVLGAVAAVIVIFVLVRLISTPGNATPTGSGQQLPSAIFQSLASVPQSDFNAVGVQSTVQPPVATPKKTPALVSGGKPEMFFMGAEYCPYCASERWAMVVALDRFGSFSHLGITQSSSSDAFPNTQTVSFYGSTYSSPYLSFVPVETQTNQPSLTGGYTSLQTPTSAQQTLVDTYDTSKYISYLPSADSGSIPFIDFGGKYLLSGASTQNLPSSIQGLTRAQIAAAIDNSSSTVATNEVGTANFLTGAICEMTNNQPASVCGTSLNKQIEAKLP